jgi:hypothetical protein
VFGLGSQREKRAELSYDGLGWATSDLMGCHCEASYYRSFSSVSHVAAT